MKHAQKMVIIPEHLLQSMETERRLTAPVQLPTLTRLDQDMKQIIESPLPEDQKLLMLDQLLQRYQGLTKQMKMESAIKPTVVLPKPDPLPATETSGKTDESTPAEASRKRDLNTSQSKSTKMPRKLPATPVTTVESKIPRRIETMPSISPEERHSLCCWILRLIQHANRLINGRRAHPWLPGYGTGNDGNIIKLNIIYVIG